MSWFRIVRGIRQLDLNAKASALDSMLKKSLNTFTLWLVFSSILTSNYFFKLLPDFHPLNGFVMKFGILLLQSFIIKHYIIWSGLIMISWYRLHMYITDPHCLMEEEGRKEHHPVFLKWQVAQGKEPVLVITA